MVQDIVSQSCQQGEPQFFAEMDVAAAVPSSKEPLWSPDHPDEQTLFNMEMDDAMLPAQTPHKSPCSPTLDTPHVVADTTTSPPSTSREEDREMPS